MLERSSDLTVLTPRQARDVFFSMSINLSEQPVRHADHSIGPLRARSLFGVFDCVFDNTTFLVELEDEQAAEFLIVSRFTSEDVCYSLHLLIGSNTAIYASRVLLPRFSACLPLDYELLVPEG